MLQAIVFVLIPAAGFLQAKKIVAVRSGSVEAARFSRALRACFLRSKIPFHARSSTRLRVNSNRHPDPSSPWPPFFNGIGCQDS
ncbi:MAG: hypothetical protein ACXW6J_12715, partial [Candidatus Binatia bacterium]